MGLKIDGVEYVGPRYTVIEDAHGHRGMGGGGNTKEAPPSLLLFDTWQRTTVARSYDVTSFDSRGKPRYLGKVGIEKRCRALNRRHERDSLARVARSRTDK